jgi:hypothetical protein
VRRQRLDPLSQQCNLDLWRAGISAIALVFMDQRFAYFGFNGHVLTPFLIRISITRPTGKTQP